MNVPEPGPRFDFRRIEPRRLASKPETPVQPQNESPTRLSLVSAGDKLSVAATSLKGSDFSAGVTESQTSDETTETRDDESTVEESAEWPDDPGDIDNNLELTERSAEEQDAKQDEHNGEQRQRKTRSLDMLEIRYCSRFRMLDCLIKRIASTDALLIQRLDHCLRTLNPNPNPLR